MEFVAESKLITGLFGKAQADLFAILGEPSCEYPYRKGMCQLYFVEGHALVVDVVDGVVCKVEQIDDRRESARIVPPGVRIAYIRAEGLATTISGYIVDMSEKSILFRLGDKQPLPSNGSSVRLCTNLEPHKGTRVYLSLSGEVMNVGDERLIVLLRRDLASMSYAYYVSYIQSMDTPHNHFNRFVPINRNVTTQIIQSDYCQHCEEKFCGI